MRKTESPIGKTFNRLYVLGFLGIKHGHKVWACHCACGNFAAVEMVARLVSGAIKSCGCLNIELLLERNQQRRKYSPEKARAKAVWRLMLKRCENLLDSGYHNYGGAGISVCERWHNFELFYEDMGDPAKGLYLDRKDTFGNYEPSNCRWVTRKVNNKNKKYHVYIEYNGQKKLLIDWADAFGVNRATFLGRKNAGWTDAEIIETPIGPSIADKEIMIFYNGKTMNLKSWALELGQKYSLFKERYARGWDIESIFTLPPTPRGKARLTIGKALTKKSPRSKIGR